MANAYIYDAIRSPRGRGKAGGGLAGLRPMELVSVLYQALVSRSDIDLAEIDDIVLGCVSQVGDQAGNIAKTSALYAGWPSHIPGITIQRFCSSGLDAINMAALKIAAGQARVVVAGGVEMMSRVPMLSDKASVFTEPELAARCQMLMMGSGADLIASQYQVSRQEADRVALLSQQRAARARDQGWFSSVVPVNCPEKGVELVHDECIRDNTTLASLAQMEPAFAELGASGIDALQLQKNPQLSEIHHIHTAGNSPALADGAALVLVGDREFGHAIGCAPRAKVCAVATVCDDPLTVISGCSLATEKLLREQGLSSADVDLFELHEAFAATVIKCQRDLNISEDKLNVNGGVIALGHPMGATGAMMAGTLLDELERRGLHRGVVAASGAAGTGVAMLIERC